MKEPKIPDQLPTLIETITKNAPDHLKASLSQMCFPGLAAHMERVCFRYIDNQLHEPSLMQVQVGATASGKGYVNQPLRAIMADVEKEDKVYRELEDTWREACLMSGDKLPRPDVCIRLISSNVTNAIFVQRLMDAQRHGGKCLYSQFNEIELLNDISRGAIGGKKEMSKILRLAYDNDEYGQERLTAQAVCGHAPIRWNWAASSTIQNTRRFFKPMLTDGTMNRIGFSFVPMLNRCMIPASGIYDQSFADEIAPAIENLRKSPRVTHEYDEVIGKKQVGVNQKGEAIMQKGILDLEKAYCVELEDGRREVYCPEAYKLAVALNQENADTWMKSDDAAFNSFSLRANVIAYKKAMVLYVANGCQWDESFEAFIRWSEQYDLWCKMQLFAKDAEPMLGDETLDTGHVKMHNMLSDLEDEFTMADLKNVRMMRGKTPDCTSQLQNWVNRGYVERIGKDYYRKVG